MLVALRNGVLLDAAMGPIKSLTSEVTTLRKQAFASRLLR
jgi:hypothetical protein